ELAGEDVPIDQAIGDDVDERLAAKRLEAMGVGAAEAERRSQQVGVNEAGGVPGPRPRVLGSGDELRSDHHIELTRLEKPDRAMVEVDVAKVDLVADHELAS